MFLLSSTLDPNGPAIECLNDAWEKNEIGECVPKAENMQLICGADGITVQLSKQLIPDATEVFLPGNCSGTFDEERKGSTLYNYKIDYSRWSN